MNDTGGAFFFDDIGKAAQVCDKDADEVVRLAFQGKFILFKNLCQRLVESLFRECLRSLVLQLFEKCPDFFFQFLLV